MNNKGTRDALSYKQEQRVVILLRETELPFSAIAQRFDVSVSHIGNVNRKHNVRQYEGHHLTWKVSA